MKHGDHGPAVAALIRDLPTLRGSFIPLALIDDEPVLREKAARRDERKDAPEIILPIGRIAEYEIELPRNAGKAGLKG